MSIPTRLAKNKKRVGWRCCRLLAWARLSASQSLEEASHQARSGHIGNVCLSGEDKSNEQREQIYRARTKHRRVKWFVARCRKASGQP